MLVIPSEGESRMVIHYQMIPHIPEDTEYFQVGPLTIGVESRLLTDGTTAAIQEGLGSIDVETIRRLKAEYIQSNSGLHDGGVSLHVFGKPNGELVEYLRFDCFKRDPHYHYGYVDSDPDQRFLDTVADGDPLTWSLERLGTKLKDMLHHAGAHEEASTINQADLDEVLPKVKNAAEKILDRWATVG